MSTEKRRERLQRRVQGDDAPSKWRGPHGYASSIVDPETGESLSGGPNDPAACRQRLRFAKAAKCRDAGDIHGYYLLMTGKDLPPDHVPSATSPLQPNATEDAPADEG